MNRRTFAKAGVLAGVSLGLNPSSVFAAADDRKLRLGFIGIGGRGSGLLKTCLEMKDVEVPAICDLVEKNIKAGKAAVEKSGRKTPQAYSKNEEDFRNLLARDDIDAVVIATGWEWHLPIAIAAMKAGKNAATEVGPATSVEECWEAVRTQEQTGVPCMLLENYAYQRPAMAVLNMVRQGIFGELIHCQCGYEHDLRQRIVEGKGTGIALAEGGDFRTHHNRTRNGDVYPTHGIGPMAHCLNIERGNRFVSLTSTASKARGLQTWTLAARGEKHRDAKTKWAMGDVVTTVIKCHNGETVTMNHDVALPRPFHTMGRVQGTKGLWEKSQEVIYLDGVSPKEHTWEPFAKYQTQYEHPLWKGYMDSGIKSSGGHWGTDYLALRDFIECTKRKLPMTIDVYDLATWMVISPLSEKSIASGSQPVEFPDFTKGKWKTNKPIFGLRGSYA